MKITVTIDDSTKLRMEEIRKALLSNSLSHVIRLSVALYYQKIFPQNVSIENIEVPQVNLPGMTPVVVRSQMERFSLSADEYSMIVRQTVDNFAASGGAIKNPEAAIFGACRRYAKNRDGQKRNTPAAETPSTPDESTYDLQDRLG